MCRAIARIGSPGKRGTSSNRARGARASGLEGDGGRGGGARETERAKNTTLLSSVTIEGMGPSLTVGGASTKAVFEVYVEKVPAPRLKEGQVVVMDDLGAHRPQRG